MQRPIQSPIGTPVEQLDTPALLVDVDQLADNLAGVTGPARVAVWLHQTPAIAERQLAAPQIVGIAVRGVAEAEVFAAAGCDDIRILRPVVTAAGRRRVEKLANSIRLITHDDGLPVAAEPLLAGVVSVSARVTSVPEPGRAIHDCGQKAIGRDFGEPRVVGGECLRAFAGSAEHGIVLFAADERRFAIGDWLALAPADIATAFALHDFAYGIREGRLAAVWPVSARGAWQ